MEELLDIAADVLRMGRAEVTPELRREDAETWDSLGHLRLIAELEDRLGVSIPIEAFDQIHTIRDFERFIV